MKQKNVILLIIVASLGYFVDIYDLIIYNIVKEKSLTDIGITGAEYIKNEISLFNIQMFRCSNVLFLTSKMSRTGREGGI